MLEPDIQFMTLKQGYGQGQPLGARKLHTGPWASHRYNVWHQ